MSMCRAGRPSIRHAKCPAFFFISMLLRWARAHEALFDARIALTKEEPNTNERPIHSTFYLLPSPLASGAS